MITPMYRVAQWATGAIPHVCDAPPGILTTEDLPHILPRGPYRAAAK
jgi:hypothetical protein